MGSIHVTPYLPLKKPIAFLCCSFAQQSKGHHYGSGRTGHPMVLSKIIMQGVCVPIKVPIDSGGCVTFVILRP